MPRRASCDCGVCPRCKKRVAQRRYRAKKRGIPYEYEGETEERVQSEGYWGKQTNESRGLPKESEKPKSEQIEPVKPLKILGPMLSVNSDLPKRKEGVSPLLYGRPSKTAKIHRLVEINGQYLLIPREKLGKSDSWLKMANSSLGEPEFTCENCGEHDIAKDEEGFYCQNCWFSRIKVVGWRG